jgi:hypothetical protein
MLRPAIRLAATLTLIASGTIGLSDAGASECRQVRGHLEETLVAGPDCTSPVGLCTVAQMFGALRGEARFTASAIIPSADTPTTGVVFVTGDTVIADATLAGLRGTLIVKDAAAFRTVGDGDLVDVQTIIGGTEDFAGTTGVLRVSGNFVATGGSSTYEGVVCRP